jgi:Ca2+-binding EF-hand superfamily protein
MPAYRQDRSVFFYIFVIINIGSFGLLNLILVTFLVDLQRGLQSNKDEKKAYRQVCLLKAFELLDVNDPKGFILKSQIRELLDELFTYYPGFYLVRPWENSAAAKEAMIKILDDDEDGLISLTEFMFLLDIARSNLKHHDTSTATDNISPAETEAVAKADNKDESNINYHPAFTEGKSRTTRYLQQLTRFYSWLYAPLLVDLVLSTLIIAELTSARNVYDISSITFVYEVVVFVLWFLDNIAVRYTAKSIRASGQVGYGVVSSHGHLRIRHRLDLALIIVMAVLFFILILYACIAAATTPIFLAIRFVQAIRLCLFPRNFLLFLSQPLVSSLVRILKKIIRSVVSMALAFYFICYFFLFIGVYAFGGKITTSSADGNEYYDKLVNTQYADNGYWNLNFNDYPSGLVTLLCCLYVSNWDVIASGFSAVTTDASSRIYFTAWYVIGVLLILNSISSFFFAGFIDGIKSSTLLDV